MAKKSTESTIENKLQDAQKLEFFGLATRFQITDDIAIEYRGAFGKENADVWTVSYKSYECYNHKAKRWEREPQPSSRTKSFIARTRCPLKKAFEIVYSPEFEKVNKKYDW